MVSLKPNRKRAGRWMRSRHAHASGVHAARTQLPGVRVMGDLSAPTPNAYNGYVGTYRAC